MKRSVKKISFDVILRNSKTKEEINLRKITIPINLSVSKKLLHKIMKDNVKKEVVNE